MAAAYVVPPSPAWGPVRVLTVALRGLGYRVAEVRGPGRDDVRLVLS